MANVMILPFLINNDVIVWLDQDYNRCFYAEHTTWGNMFQAICSITYSRGNK